MSEKHGLPWHRVIRADGSIALENGGGRELQAALLRAEGVEVSESGRVDMARYGGKGDGGWPAVTGRSRPKPAPGRPRAL
jgi:methylated-DNA-protein-cysteine methyltransferase-like protein